MSRTLINSNPLNGVRTYVHDNPDDHRLIVESVYDRQPYLDHAARMRAEVQQRGEGPRYIGTIPLTLYFQWMREGKLGDLDENGQPYNVDPEKIRALLNSPEYKLLKTVDGQA